MIIDFIEYFNLFEVKYSSIINTADAKNSSFIYYLITFFLIQKIIVYVSILTNDKLQYLLTRVALINENHNHCYIKYQI